MSSRYIGLALVALLGFAVAFAAQTWTVPMGSALVHEPCPEMPLSVHASEVQLRPIFERHQNWVAFEVPARFTGHYALCMGDRLLQVSGGRQIFKDGVARFHIRTSWVHLQRALGTLPEYRALARWSLGLHCERPRQCVEFGALQMANSG